MSIETHPVQKPNDRRPGRVPVAVTMAAYEVYCEVFAPQKALIEGSCRGGFGVCELIGFLYAGRFPRSEWKARFQEAIEGMEGLS